MSQEEIPGTVPSPLEAPRDTVGAAPPDSLKAEPATLLPVPILTPREMFTLRSAATLGIDTWTSSPGQEFPESLEREFLFQRQISGSVVATPERLWRTGPGWENWSLLDDGMPAEDPSAPFAHFPGWSPAWIGSVTWLPYDPVWVPLASGASGVAWVETVHRPRGTPSAVRLTTGTYETTTKEALVERDFLGSRIGFFYGNFRSGGRDVIRSNRGQNLLFRCSRPFGRSWVLAEWGSRFSQVKWTQSRKLRWEESTVRLRSTVPLGEKFAVEGRLQLFHQLWRWRGLDGTTRRRSKILDGSLLGQLPLENGHRLVSSARVLVIERSWEASGPKKSNTDELGIALAAGWRGSWGVSRWRLSGGLELREHDDRAVHPVVSAGYRLGRGPGLHLRADGWSAVEAASSLTLANEYEEILLRGGPESLGTGGSLQRVHHVDIGVGVTGESQIPIRSSRGSTMAELSVFYEDRRSAGGSEGAESTSKSVGTSPTKARLGLEGSARFLLPLRFWIEARGTWLLSPSEPTDHLWLPKWSTEGIVGTSVSFLQGEILLEGRLTWTARGKWNTPFGVLGSDDNIDGELRLWIGDVAVFAVLRNMEDDIRASSSYDNGWIPRPRRNGALGVTWRFSN